MSHGINPPRVLASRLQSPSDQEFLLLQSASSGKNDDILVQEILKGVANANTDSDEGDDEAALSQCDSYISLKINSLTTQVGLTTVQLCLPTFYI